jgi:hypothetical protein
MLRAMKLYRVLGAAAAAGIVLAVACGEDEGLVRPRNDGGAGDASADGSGCALDVPSTYDSPTFETNAARELTLRKSFDDFIAPFASAEAALDAGTTPTATTKAQLDALYVAGSPSVKEATAEPFQSKVSAYIAAYAAAIVDGAYVPQTPDGGDKGGSLGAYIFDGNGLDLRQAIEKGTLSAAFYRQAVEIAAASPLTVGTIDRLVAVYGAHPSFPNNPSAPQNKDVLVAAYAARRDAKDAANPGPYQRIRRALLTARSAVLAGCTAERDAALRIFFREWERATFASVVFDLSDVIAKLAGPGANDAAILHAFGEAAGLVTGFKFATGPHKIATDAQIDGLLQRMFAADGAPSEAYKLKTSPVEAATRLQQAIGDIKGIYGFSDAEIDAFKTSY